MTRKPITLIDGRILQPAGQAGIWYLPNGETVRAEIDGDRMRLFIPGSGGEELTGGIIDQAAEAGQPGDSKSSPETNEAAKKKRDRTRWATFNTFVDRVARHLDAAEASVWYVIFRWTQDDTAEIRLSDIAARVGKSTRSVQRAVDRLIEVGLLERLKRGTRQGGPSRYRLESDPAIAIPTIQSRQSAQRDAGVRLKQPPEHKKRDKKGAFTT